MDPFMGKHELIFAFVQKDKVSGGCKEIDNAVYLSLICTVVISSVVIVHTADTS